MSLGTLDQLIVNQENNDILGNPSITFFKPNYRRFVNYSKTEQQYQLQQAKFNSSVSFKFPKTDYINNIILSIVLPEIKCKFKSLTKQEIKDKLKNEYGFNWNVKDLNSEMTDDDFKELIGEIIDNNREGGLIPEYIKNLIDKKEYYEKLLKVLNNVIKYFVEQMTYDELNNLFNINYTQEQYIDLLNKFDIDFKSIVSTTNDNTIVINKELMYYDYEYVSQQLLNENNINNVFDYLKKCGILINEKDKIIDILKTLDLSYTNLTKELYNTILNSIKHLTDKAELITTKLFQGVYNTIIRNDLLKYIDEDNDKWEQFIKTDLVITFDGIYVNCFELYKSIFIYFCDDELNLNNTTTINLINIMNMLTDNTINVDDNMTNINNLINSFSNNENKNIQEAAQKTQAALSLVNKCRIKEMLQNINENLCALILLGNDNLFDLFNNVVKYYKSSIILCNDYKNDNGIISEDVIFNGLYGIVNKNTVSDEEALSNAYSLFNKAGFIYYNTDPYFYTYNLLKYNISSNKETIQPYMNEITELINNHYKDLYNYSNLLYSNFQNLLNNTFTQNNNFVNYELIIEFINNTIKSDVFDFLNMEVDFYYSFDEMLNKLSSTYPSIVDKVKYIDIENVNGKQFNQYIYQLVKIFANFSNDYKKFNDVFNEIILDPINYNSLMIIKDYLNNSIIMNENNIKRVNEAINTFITNFINCLNDQELYDRYISDIRYFVLYEVLREENETFNDFKIVADERFNKCGKDVQKVINQEIKTTTLRVLLTIITMNESTNTIKNKFKDTLPTVYSELENVNTIYDLYLYIYNEFNNLVKNDYSIDNLNTLLNITSLVNSMTNQVMNDNYYNNLKYTSLIETDNSITIYLNDKILYIIDLDNKYIKEPIYDNDNIITNYNLIYYSSYEKNNNIITLTTTDDKLYIDLFYQKCYYYSYMINIVRKAIKRALIYIINNLSLIFDDNIEVNTSRKFNVNNLTLTNKINNFKYITQYYNTIDGITTKIFELNTTDKRYSLDNNTTLDNNVYYKYSNYNKLTDLNGTTIIFTGEEDETNYYTITDNYIENYTQNIINYSMIYKNNNISTNSKIDTEVNNAYLFQLDNLTVHNDTIEITNANLDMLIYYNNTNPNNNRIFINFTKNNTITYIEGLFYVESIEENSNKIKLSINNHNVFIDYTTNQITLSLYDDITSKLTNYTFTISSNTMTYSITLYIGNISDCALLQSEETINSYNIFLNNKYITNIVFNDNDSQYYKYTDTNNTYTFYHYTKKYYDQQIDNIYFTELLNNQSTTNTIKQLDYTIIKSDNKTILKINNNEYEVNYNENNKQIILTVVDTINESDNIITISDYKLITINKDVLTIEYLSNDITNKTKQVKNYPIEKYLIVSFNLNKVDNNGLIINTNKLIINKTNNNITIDGIEYYNVKSISKSSEIIGNKFDANELNDEDVIELNNEEDINELNNEDVINELNNEMNNNDQDLIDLLNDEINALTDDVYTIEIDNEIIQVDLSKSTVNILISNYMYYDSYETDITYKTQDDITIIDKFNKCVVRSYLMNQTFEITGDIKVNESLVDDDDNDITLIQYEQLILKDNINSIAKFHSIKMRGACRYLKTSEYDMLIFISSLDKTKIIINFNTHAVEIHVNYPDDNSTSTTTFDNYDMINYGICLDNALIFINDCNNIIDKYALYACIQGCREFTTSILKNVLDQYDSTRLHTDVDWLLSLDLSKKSYTSIYYSIITMLLLNYKITNISELITTNDDMFKFIKSLYSLMTLNTEYPYLFNYYVNNYLINNNQIDNNTFFNEYIKITYQLYKLYSLDLINKIKNVTSEDNFNLIKETILNYDGLNIIDYANQQLLESTNNNYIQIVFDYARQLLNKVDYFEFFILIIKELFNIIDVSIDKDGNEIPNNNYNTVMMYLLNYIKDENEISQYDLIKNVVSILTNKQSVSNIFSNSDASKIYLTSNRYPIVNSISKEEVYNGSHSWYHNMLLTNNTKTDNTTTKLNVVSFEHPQTLTAYKSLINSTHYDDIINRYRINENDVLKVDGKLNIKTYLDFYELSEFYTFNNDISNSDQKQSIIYIYDNKKSKKVQTLDIIPVVQEIVNNYYVVCENYVIPTIVYETSAQRDISIKSLTSINRLDDDEIKELINSKLSNITIDSETLNSITELARNLYLYYFTILVDFKNNDFMPHFYIHVKYNLTINYTITDNNNEQRTGTTTPKELSYVYYTIYNNSVSLTEIDNVNVSFDDNIIHPVFISLTPILVDKLGNEYYFRCTIDNNNNNKLLFEKDKNKVNNNLITVRNFTYADYVEYVGFVKNNELKNLEEIQEDNQKENVNKDYGNVDVFIKEEEFNTKDNNISNQSNYLNYYIRYGIRNSNNYQYYNVNKSLENINTIYDIKYVVYNTTDDTYTIGQQKYVYGFIIQKNTTGQLMLYYQYYDDLNNNTDLVKYNKHFKYCCISNGSIFTLYKIDSDTNYLTIVNNEDEIKDVLSSHVILNFNNTKDVINNNNLLSYYDTIDTEYNTSYDNDYKLISYNSYCYLLSIVNNNKNIEKFNVMYNINSSNNINLVASLIRINNKTINIPYYSTDMYSYYYQIPTIEDVSETQYIIFELINPGITNITYLDYIGNTNDKVIKINDLYVYASTNNQTNICKSFMCSDSITQINYTLDEFGNSITSEIKDYINNNLSLPITPIYELSNILNNAILAHAEIINNIVKLKCDDESISTINMLNNKGMYYYICNLSTPLAVDSNIYLYNGKFTSITYDNEYVMFTPPPEKNVVNLSLFSIINNEVEHSTKMLYELKETYSKSTLNHVYKRYTKKITTNNCYFISSYGMYDYINLIDDTNIFSIFTSSLFIIDTNNNLSLCTLSSGKKIFIVSNSYKNYYVNKELINIQIINDSTSNSGVYDNITPDTKEYHCICSNNLPLTYENKIIYNEIDNDKTYNCSFINNSIYKYDVDKKNFYFVNTGMTEDNGIFTIVIDNTIDEIIYNDAYVQVNNIKYQIKPESLIGLTFYTESSNSLINIIKTEENNITTSTFTTDKKYLIIVNKLSEYYGNILTYNGNDWIVDENMYDLWYNNDFSIILKINHDEIINTFTNQKQEVNDRDVIMINKDDIWYTGNEVLNQSPNPVFDIKVVDKSTDTITLKNEVYIKLSNETNVEINNKYINVCSKDSSFKQFLIIVELSNTIYNYQQYDTIYDYIKNTYTLLTNEEFDTTSNLNYYLQQNYNKKYDTITYLQNNIKSLVDEYYNYLTTTYITDITIFNTLISCIDNYNDKPVYYVYTVNPFVNTIQQESSEYNNYFDIKNCNIVNYNVNVSYVNEALKNTKLLSSNVSTDLYKKLLDVDINTAINNSINKIDIITFSYDDKITSLESNTFYDLYYTKRIQEMIGKKIEEVDGVESEVNKPFHLGNFIDKMFTDNDAYYFIADYVACLLYYYGSRDNNVIKCKYAFSTSTVLNAQEISDFNVVKNMIRELYDKIISSCNITKEQFNQLINIETTQQFSVAYTRTPTYTYIPIAFNYLMTDINIGSIAIALDSEQYCVYVNQTFIELLVNALIYEVIRIIELFKIVNNGLIVNDEIINRLNRFKEILLNEDLSKIIKFKIPEDDDLNKTHPITYNDNVKYLTTVDSILKEEFTFIDTIINTNINDEIITETPFNYFYDNIIILTNYVFTTYHKVFNNQYNILFDNKYTNFYNPLKECTDYVVNYLPITTINDNCETEVDYYVNANTISINLLPYIKLILNETLNSYQTMFLYKNTFRYYNQIYDINKYEKNTNIYYSIIEFFYDNIITNQSLLNKNLFESLLLNGTDALTNFKSILNYDYEDPEVVSGENIHITTHDAYNFKYFYMTYRQRGYTNLQNEVLKVFMFNRLYYDIIDNLNKSYLPLLSNLNYDHNYINIFDIFNYDKILRTKELSNKATLITDTNKQKFMKTVVNKIFDITTDINDYFNNDNIIKSCINYLVSFVNEITLINSIEDENIKQLKLNELVNSLPTNLKLWYTEYSKYINNITNTLLKVYGLNDSNIDQLKITPDVLNNHYDITISLLFNSFKTEMDFVKFLIYYLIDTSELNYLIKIFENNNNNYDLFIEIQEYYNKLYNQALDKLNKIGYYEEDYIKDGITYKYYSKAEDELRDIWDKYNKRIVNYAWNEEIGFYLIEKIDLVIGDQVIDTLTSEMMHIYYKLFTTEEHKRSIDQMIGNSKDLYTYDNTIKPKKQLLIPLYFFFNRYFQSSFPMLSLINSDAQLVFKFNSFEKIFRKNEFTIIEHMGELKDAFIICDKININEQDRINESSKLQRMLIDQHQYYKSIVNAKTLNNNRIVKLSNRWYGNSKEMFLLAHCKNNRLNDYMNNGKDIIKSIQIKYNEQIRQQKENIKYYGLCNKLNHTYNDNDGIYVYSFSLFPEAIQPSGSANMALIGEVEIELEIDEECNDIIEFTWINKNINFLNFVGGQAGLMYQNVDLS